LSELHGLDLGIETLRQWMLLAVAALILAVIAGIQAWILATTDASTRESARAAIKSASTAEDALKNARENFRVEQRPIIWLTNDLGVPQFMPNPIRQPEAPALPTEPALSRHAKPPLAAAEAGVTDAGSPRFRASEAGVNSWSCGSRKPRSRQLKPPLMLA